jgi:hypothetical protein
MYYLWRSRRRLLLLNLLLMKVSAKLSSSCWCRLTDMVGFNANKTLCCNLLRLLSCSAYVAWPQLCVEPIVSHSLSAAQLIMDMHNKFLDIICVYPWVISTARRWYLISRVTYDTEQIAHYIR